MSDSPSASLQTPALPCFSTSQAACDLYGLKIYVITSFKDRYVIVIEPTKKQHPKLLYLSFWAEVRVVGNLNHPAGLGAAQSCSRVGMGASLC
jgi:hypothetical protein